MDNTKYLYLKDIANVIFVLNTEKSDDKELLQCITASHLLSDNRIEPNFEYKAGTKDETNRVFKGDIMIKRVSPAYVNYVNESFDNVYAYNNLIIVKPNNNVDSKYLACVINQRIKKLSVKTSVGSVLPSLGKNELELLKIPIIPIEKQSKIGALWYLGIERKKHLIRLAELQSIKDNYVINKYIDAKTGGNQSDYI